MILPVTGLAVVSRFVLVNTPPQYVGSVIAELGMVNHACPFGAATVPTQLASPTSPSGVVATVKAMEPTVKASGVAPSALRACLTV